MSHSADSGDRTSPRSFWRIVRTWPGRVAIAVCGVLLATAGTYFGTQMWDAARRAAGEDSLTVRVLYAGEFSSPLHALGGTEIIWEKRASDIPHYSSRAEARDLGAVDVSATLVRLNLSSTFTERVTIQRIAVNVERREPPLRGVWVKGDKGGVADVRYIGIDLEQGTTEWTDGMGDPIPPMTIYVDGNTEENVDILAEARNGQYQWNLELTYTVGGGEPQMLIVSPPEAEVFTTSSLENASVLNVSTDTCTEPWDPSLRRPPPVSSVRDPLC